MTWQGHIFFLSYVCFFNAFMLLWIKAIACWNLDVHSTVDCIYRANNKENKDAHTGRGGMESNPYRPCHSFLCSLFGKLVSSVSFLAEQWPETTAVCSAAVWKAVCTVSLLSSNIYLSPLFSLPTQENSMPGEAAPLSLPNSLSCQHAIARVKSRPGKARGLVMEMTALCKHTKRDGLCFFSASIKPVQWSSYILGEIKPTAKICVGTLN